MDIVIVSIEEPVYIYQFWKYLLEELHTQVCRIYIFKPTFKKWQRIIYEMLYNLILVLYLYRLKDIILVMKNYLYAVLTNKRKLFCSLSSLADYYGIPVFIIDSVNSRKFKNELRQVSPDLILAQIPVFVSKETLSIPRIGWVNKHFGILPDYKGAFPFLWARWNREQFMGVTIHFMNEQYDDGDIIDQKTEEVQFNESLPSILGRLNRIAADLMVECIKNNSRAQVQMNRNNHFLKKPTIRKLLRHFISESIYNIR